MKHSDVPSILAKILNRPARWAPTNSRIGSYDGQERTLQVFNVEAKEQPLLLDHIEPYRSSLEQAAGGPLLIIFLSTRQSLRHAEFIKSFEFELPIQRISRKGLPALGPNCVDTESHQGPHRKVA